MTNARSLPDDIARDLDKLMVARRGDTPGSYMITEDIIGHVAPGTRYRLEPDRLTQVGPAARAAGAPPGPAPTAPPPHRRLSGVWDDGARIATAEANILGGLGTLTLTSGDLTIPQAPPSPDALGFYGARLVAWGEELEFETDRDLPVAVMDIGADYVRGYLHVESKGGGSFLEYHDRPHLHMPLDRGARGHIVIGRTDGADYLVSGFPIPFGHALYTPPMALHADPYLVGRYLVIYSVTENFSTVLFRTGDGRVVNARITVGS